MAGETFMHAPDMEPYEALGDLSGQMLDAAREADWPRLAHLEQASLGLVSRLPQAGTDWDHAGHEWRQRRQQILLRILSDDAEIRDLAQPWLCRARQYLSSLRLEREWLKQRHERHGEAN